MLILATGAAVMALIPVVGAVYAQLIVAGVFLLVIVVHHALAATPGSREPARARAGRRHCGRGSGEARRNSPRSP